MAAVYPPRTSLDSPQTTLALTAVHNFSPKNQQRIFAKAKIHTPSTELDRIVVSVAHVDCEPPERALFISPHPLSTPQLGTNTVAELPTRRSESRA